MNQLDISATQRLYGVIDAQKIQGSRMSIIGLGGVGSWVAESLARVGVGHLQLVDMDEICSSNLNRQVHATQSTVGVPKVEAMQERIHHIAPKCEIDVQMKFFSVHTADTLLESRPHIVIDCIDSIPHKCLLLSECKKRNLKVVTVGAAGGKRNPSDIQTVDLSRTYGDALLQRVRKKLRQNYDFPRNIRKRWRIPAVFSPEPVVLPQSDDRLCAEREPNQNLRLDCNSGYGTSGFVTGSFGFAAAAAAISLLIDPLEAEA